MFGLPAAWSAVDTVIGRPQEQIRPLDRTRLVDIAPDRRAAGFVRRASLVVVRHCAPENVIAETPQFRVAPAHFHGNQQMDPRLGQEAIGTQRVVVAS